MTDEPEVLAEVRDGVGYLTLNRPRALNALSHGMVQILAAALTDWADRDDVVAVVVTGSGDRAFCAGGDIRAIYQDALAGTSSTLDFWRDEYRLNAQIAGYPKPYVPIMAGLVLGGGVGVSAHGSHRIVTDSTRVGMPEVTIGFVPDVGGTYLLSRQNRELGIHAALTSANLGPADAIAAGLADHYVPEPDLPAFLDSLAEHGVDHAVARFAAKPPTGIAGREWIATAYAADTVPEILQALRANASEESTAAADAIERAAPVAVSVTLRALRDAADSTDLRQVLNREFGVGAIALRSWDFPEGVRAQIIDKDRNPQWRPATLAEVDTALVESYFAPVADLPFPDPTHLIDQETRS